MYTYTHNKVIYSTYSLLAVSSVSSADGCGLYHCEMATKPKIVSVLRYGVLGSWLLLSPSQFSLLIWNLCMYLIFEWQK